MVTINRIITYVRADKRIESESVITAADGDTVTANELGLQHISYVKGVAPRSSGHVAGAAAITNPDSIANDVTLTLYSLTANSDSLVSAGSVDWLITTVQE